MAKKKTSSYSLKPYHSHHHIAQSVIAFMVVLLAFAIFLVYKANEEYIVTAGKYELFVLLTTIAMGLLIGLVFLVNQSSDNKKKK